jgi:hypothetical protein
MRVGFLRIVISHLLLRDFGANGGFLFAYVLCGAEELSSTGAANRNCLIT